MSLKFTLNSFVILVAAADLLSGQGYVDPSIFRYKEKWWMFSSTGNNDVLNLYYSDHLHQGWQGHKNNPVVKLNAHSARPGGRIIFHNDKLYRMAQDGKPYYGIQIFAYEITKLSEALYEEKLSSINPIITKSGSGWNKTGMHHIDAQEHNGQWIAVVDGQDDCSEFVSPSSQENDCN